MAPISFVSALALLALTSTTTFVAAEPMPYARHPQPLFMKRATGGFFYPTGTGFGTGTGYARPTGTGFPTGVFPPGFSVPAGEPSATSVAGASATGGPGAGPGSAGPGGSTDCATPITVTVQNTQTITVTVATGGPGAGASVALSQPTGPPYTIPGQSGPAGGPTASGTGLASASAPSGSAYATNVFGMKRGLEMRGLKHERDQDEKEKREGWWFA